MQWYVVTKKIKGRPYRYWQRTYRVAGKVKTESQYLGPGAKATSGTASVTSLDGEGAEVPIIDRTTSPPEPPEDPPAPPSLQLDKYTRWRTDISQRALVREERQAMEQMRKLGVNTTNLKPIRLHHGRKVSRRERDDGYYVYGPSDGERTAFKREFRRALAERWVDAIKEQQPDRYRHLCDMVGLELSWTNSGAKPIWLSLLSDLWHRRRRGHHAAVEMLAEILQRGRAETQAKYYHEDGETERAEIRAWQHFERLKQPAARKRQFAEWKRLRAISTAAGIKHGQAIWVRRWMFDERPVLSRKEKAKRPAKKSARRRRYRRRRYPRWSR